MAYTTEPTTLNKAVSGPRNPSFVSPIENAADDVRSLRARIEALADRLCGTVPENAGSDLREVASGVFDQVADMGRGISSNVGAAREALDRIERSLP